MVKKYVSGTYTQIVYGPAGNDFATMNGQTLVKAFIPLPSAIAVYTASGLAYYRHGDHHGSSRLASTPSRTLYSSTAYAPYGESYNQAGTTDLSFTGQDQDTVSGLYDFAARHYNPSQGRWMVPDPAGLQSVDFTTPQSWNRYGYVLDNPMSLVDPLGLECVWDDGSYDAEDDPDTGSPAQCAAQGGNWIELGANGAWNPDPGSADPTNAVATLPSETVTVNANDPGMPCNPGTACYIAFAANKAWNYLKTVPLNLTVIVPVAGIIGPAVTVTYLPKTKNLCVAPGLGASVGRNVSGGPLVLGNLKNAKSITEGASISAGAQGTPLLGAQATGNFSGVLGGPTVGIPGGSAAVTYGVCF